ncbi:MAG: TIGR04086 family membrane protein [Ruminococcus sp.]|nr:TIGR04086 family membrane protein [Ruminococcus sp.]
MKNYSTEKLKIIDKKLLKSLIFGVLCGIAAITILTLLLSFVLVISGEYPTDIINYISLAFLLVGGLVGGYIAARLNKGAGLIVGAFTGFIIFVIILLVGLSQSAGTITLFTLYKLLVLVIFAALGGILGVNKKNKIKI